jgi:hypothetical protein
MTKHDANTKKCALCATDRSLKQFLSIKTADGKTLLGTVCHICLGIDKGSLFNRRPKNKLLFAQDHFFPHLNEDDDDDGSGGWDPEDRARRMELILTVDSQSRGATSKADLKKAEKKLHEHKRLLEKWEKNKNKRRESKQALDHSENQPENQAESQPENQNIKPEAVTDVSVFSNNRLFANEKTNNDKTHNVTYTTNTAPNKQSGPNTKNDTASTTKTTQQENRTTAPPNEESKPTKINPNTPINNATLQQLQGQNDRASNSHQRLGQTLTFLSPFGSAGTEIRNKATKGLNASYMSNMFGKDPSTATVAAKREAVGDESKAEIKTGRAQEMYERAKMILKK